MDNSYCCVSQCNSRGSDYPRTSFHRFPNPKDSSSMRLREEWIRILKIGKKVSKRMVVCGKHFQPSDFFPRSKKTEYFFFVSLVLTLKINNMTLLIFYIWKSGLMGFNARQLSLSKT